MTAQNDNHKSPRVAVIGTGTMGAAVAGQLLAAGIELNVWNRHPGPAMALAELGATVYNTPHQAVEMAAVVLTWLPTGEATTDVMLDQRVIDDMTQGAVWAQMGTIGLEATTRLQTGVQTRRPDVSFVDAPVSGSRGPAESGQLLILASGPQGLETTLRPIFDAIGRRTLWLGAAGMGTRMKLVLNTWLAFEVEAAAEAAALATELGLDPDAIRAATDGNPVASPLAEAKLSKISSGDHRADFALQWALKDHELMRTADTKAAAPIAANIAKRWHTLIDQGLGGLDVSAARIGLGDDQSIETEQATPAVRTDRRSGSPVDEKASASSQ
jgi:3-hydroxyisobutyrate dehydrogenase